MIDEKNISLQFGERMYTVICLIVPLLWNVSTATISKSLHVAISREGIVLCIGNCTPPSFVVRSLTIDRVVC